MITSIEIIPSADLKQQTIQLPYRNLDKLRYFGFLGFLATMFQIGFGLTFMGLPLSILLNGKQNGNLPIPLVIFTSIFALIGCRICWIGLRIAMGSLGFILNQTRTQITISERELICREQFGWVSLKHKIKLTPDYQLIKDRSWNLQFEGKLQRFLERFVTDEIRNWWNLTVHSHAVDASAKRFVAGYPEQIIRDLEGAIYDFVPTTASKQSIDSLSTDSSTETHQISNRSQLSSDRSSAASISFQPPSKTKIKYESRDSGITFFIPPPGFVAGSSGLIIFACIWLSFMVFFDVAILSGAKVDGQKPGDSFPIMGIVILGIFHLIGGGLLLGAIYLAKRSATIATSDGMLMVSELTIFGKRLKQWDENTIRSVEIVPSNVKVNGKPIPELAIHDDSGSTFRCIGYLKQEELDWVAWEISNSLGLYSHQESSLTDSPPNLSPN